MPTQLLGFNDMDSDSELFQTKWVQLRLGLYRVDSDMASL